MNNLGLFNNNQKYLERRVAAMRIRDVDTRMLEIKESLQGARCFETRVC
jgi:hypothetical protein